MDRIRSFSSLVLVAACLTGGMISEAGAKDVVRDVVKLQLNAFRKNEFKSAYGFAHSAIKAKFTAPQFEQMVRGGFPAMVEPGAVEMGEVRQEGGAAEVQLILTDGRGNRSGFQYLLEKEGGEWRIASVVPIQLQDVLAGLTNERSPMDQGRFYKTVRRGG